MFQFTYTINLSFIDTFLGKINNLTTWDIDYKYFFKSSDNENAFLSNLSKGFSDGMFQETFNNMG
jgi:hypothetical protein